MTRRNSYTKKRLHKANFNAQQDPQEPPTRAFLQARLRHGICKISICKIFMQGPCKEDPTKISTRSSVKGLYRIMQDLLEDVSRISKKSSPRPRSATTALCEPAQSKCTWTSHKGLLTREFAPKMLCLGTRQPTTLCEYTLRSQKMWRENLEEKWHAPGVRQPFVQACTVRNAHGDLTRVDYWRFYRKITAPQERDNRFVRACALEMHMDMSQEQSYARIYRRKCRAPNLTPTFCASLRSLNRGLRFVRACAVEMRMHGHFTKATFFEKLLQMESLI